MTRETGTIRSAIGLTLILIPRRREAGGRACSPHQTRPLLVGRTNTLATAEQAPTTPGRFAAWEFLLFWGVLQRGARRKVSETMVAAGCLPCFGRNCPGSGMYLTSRPTRRLPPLPLLSCLLPPLLLVRSTLGQPWEQARVKRGLPQQPEARGTLRHLFLLSSSTTRGLERGRKGGVRQGLKMTPSSLVWGWSGW